MELLSEYAVFLTATIYRWKPLLNNESYKKIIIDSLRFLVKDDRIYVNAFVIMNNHIHLIWQAREGYKTHEVQRDFLKYTAQMIKFDLQKNDSELLAEFRVNHRDRSYQIWQRNPLSIDLFSEKVFKQKLDYIHYNPVKAGYCQLPEEYPYSSASFYFKSDPYYSFLTHYDD